MKALIIEDDPQIVEAISLALGMRWPDSEVISSHLGRKGVEIVKDDSPDIVILDLGLPDIHGFEVLKQIRTFAHPGNYPDHKQRGAKYRQRTGTGC